MSSNSAANNYLSQPSQVHEHQQHSNTAQTADFPQEILITSDGGASGDQHSAHHIAATAAAAASVRRMKNLTDLEINDLLGLIPDEYAAEEQAAANAAMALGKGIHHSVTVPQAGHTTVSVASGTNKPESQQHFQQHQPQTDSGMNEKSQESHSELHEAQIRSERKRSREKQRRNDVNKQFAELTEVLKMIEREAQEQERKEDSYASVSTMMAIAASTGPTNRVDLIARTIAHLERLNRAAKRQRVEIRTLKDELERTKKAGEEMAEKLKDVMFSQQHQSQAYAPYPQMLAAASPSPAGAPTAAAPSVAPQVMAAPMSAAGQRMPQQQQQQLPQQMPMMMMMMPPSNAAGTSGTNVSTQQQQQRFMMVMPHPGSQVSMPGMQQMMQPMQQQTFMAQSQQQQQQTQVIQQQQHQHIAPAPPQQQQQSTAQGNTTGGKTGSGTDFAQAA